jgi:hypothetical protein
LAAECLKIKVLLFQLDSLQSSYIQEGTGLLMEQHIFYIVIEYRGHR